ncbi:secreted protein [Rhodopirellula maiorica SM1]|uniref:Secreted protein n=1 Tax=Rhodopirellula maiorica SM1 TaxID=1265738 RepID=M5R7T0_9BACT|nr:hypothetical protein [Rhodopirellula maiorica]EMI15543.1 secreted protein [Rhodopirellula maiorica SM1]
MKRSWFAVAAIVVSFSLVGCDDSGVAKVEAEKEEIAKWVEENPTPLVTDDDAVVE